MQVYAAVIEWPGESEDPTLVLASSQEARAAEIAAEIRETADMFTDSDWVDAIASTGTDEWAEWLDALDATRHGRPWVSLYEREV